MDEQAQSELNEKAETKSFADNPLGTKSITGLMIKFAIPSIIAMIVGAVYNLVDQAFLGTKIGPLANAATNIAFPFTTACIAMSLLFGIGGASAFNLAMGKGDKENAPYFVGNSAFSLVFFGTVLSVISELFLEQLLVIFGSPAEVLPYAISYVRMTAIGFPFLMLTTGGGHLIRADGSPHITMICNLVGALLNVGLDALFVLKFEWGMFGAAFATVIGQVVSAIIVLVYLAHYRTVHLSFKHMKLKPKRFWIIASIGMGSFFNQLAMLVVQVVMNNSLNYYGSRSVYGGSIPLAAAGIVIKVAQVFFAIVIGIAQGSQPVESFNYGAKNYDRVRKAYKVALIAGLIVSVPAFLIFQFLPRQILIIFGEGTPEYYEFAVRFFRIFLFFVLLNFIQPITATMFTSIGKAFKGAFLSLTRQILFLIPLIVILPMFFGIDGIMYSAPVADFLALIATVIMAALEFRNMRKLEQQEKM